MNKLILIISAVCMLLGGMHAALAHRPGQCPCSFQKQLIERSGFNSQTKYSPEDIRQILASINVKLSSSCPQCKHPRCTRYCYICVNKNYRAKSILIPESGGQPIVWYSTQPF
jgi:hypothetical protein